MASSPSNRRPLVVFLSVDQVYADRVKLILERASRDIERQILRAAGKPLNPVSQIQLFTQQQTIKAALNQDWMNIGAAIAKGKLDAAAVAGRISVEMQAPIFSLILPPADVQAIVASEAARAVTGLESVLARLQSSYIPLSARVYNNIALTNGRVDAMVNSALVRGLNARDFAKEVRQFVSPTTPGGMSYAAMRLSRTEINNAFHATAVDRYQQNVVVSEVEWNLSRSHPEKDVCDQYAAERYPVNEVPAKPHPFCFCFITPHLPEPADFMRRLLDGGYDNAPWQSPRLSAAVREVKSALPRFITPRNVAAVSVLLLAQYAKQQEQIPAGVPVLVP